MHTSRGDQIGQSEERAGFRFSTCAVRLPVLRAR